MRAAWGEVVVMYGDTVLAVQHVRPDDRARARAAGLLALGVVMGLVGAAVFVADVAQDWEGHAAVQRAAQQRGDVRPPGPGPGFGDLGAALMLLGVVPLVLGAVRLRDRRHDRFTLGEAPEASLQVALGGLPGPVFPLLCAEDGPVLRVTDATRGELWTGTSLRPLAGGGEKLLAGVRCVALAEGARARVDHGAVSLWISAVAAETATVARGRVDRPTGFYSGCALVLFAGIAMLGHVLPEQAVILDLESDVELRAQVRYLHREQVVVQGRVDESGGGHGVGERNATAGTSGAGGRRAPRKGAPGHSVRRGLARGVVVPGGGVDRESAARRAGVLALMVKDAGWVASEREAYVRGDGDGDVWGGLSGAQIGDLDRVGGLGLVGTGVGGGLHAEGVIGLGGLRGAGGGGGTCTCGGRGGDGAGFGGRGVRTPSVRAEAGAGEGGLEMAVVRRIVRTHLAEIRHCYDQVLARDPAAHGRLEIHFMIGGAGAVSSAAVGESDMRDAELGACATLAVRRWRFPRPEGGRGTFVRYPFVFTPA